MYTEYYDLKGSPFRLNPDHRFFYVAEPHKKALAHLRYALNRNEGFVVITGEVGAGKTTLVNRILSELEESRYVTGTIVTSLVQHEDLLPLIAATFGIEPEAENKASLLMGIRTFLEEERALSRRPILFVDEVQNLPESSLEELRMLSNFSLPGESLLQIFLVGQPEFRETLADERMEQLRQRVVTSCHLGALHADDTRSYIYHRLSFANWSGKPEFSDPALEAIHLLSDGVPRRINVICDRLLLHGFLEQLQRIDHEAVAAVARDMMDEGLLTVLAGVPDARTPEESEIASASEVTETPDARILHGESSVNESAIEPLSDSLSDPEPESKADLEPGEAMAAGENGASIAGLSDALTEEGIYIEDAPSDPEVEEKGSQRESSEEELFETLPHSTEETEDHLEDDAVGLSPPRDTVIPRRRPAPLARYGLAASIVLVAVALPAGLLFQVPETLAPQDETLTLARNVVEKESIEQLPEVIAAALTASDDKSLAEEALFQPASDVAAGKSSPETVIPNQLQPGELTTAVAPTATDPGAVERADSGNELLPEPESLLKSVDSARPASQSEPLEDRFLIQLAALRSAEEASQLHQQFEAAFQDLLKGFDLRVHKAEIAGTGYFRVMTEVGADRETMSVACAKIKSTGQDCILVLDTTATDRAVN
ncbi:AAA family ATPase [Denitrobaculum tricleocarpae]|uniref:AAA family ATPase n=1 Tax=Denitrobaculum tricleocarpae TaxID=2591009 RepID=A0A545TQC7_9PROT|nr:AAA family ATPase [Denitrobaculum tricleocarpae]TQV79321.1 AAA family ATPase [Denitrobaculum tricleocarpae]